MSKALDAQDRDMLYSMCSWGSYGVWRFADDIANSYRTTGDISANWESISKIYEIGRAHV